MSRLNLHRPDASHPATCEAAADAGPVAPADRRATPQPTPLLLDINALSVALSRSVASLHRDDGAGRLPVALRIGGSKRWRASDISLWVEMGCPSRAEFEARRNRR